MNFAEQGVNAKDIDVNLKKEQEIIRMREMKIKFFMLMQLEKCRNERGWLLRYQDCIVTNCPEENNLSRWGRNIPRERLFEHRHMDGKRSSWKPYSQYSPMT